MLTVLGSRRRCCDNLTRRETLKVGALSALGGFSLADFFALSPTATAAAEKARAKSVIVLYLLGGAATQDMWDLKPNAPAEIRGEFRPAATSVPGIQICEHLPRTARWMKRMAIVRSVNHQAGCHNTLPSYTGFEQSVADNTTTKDSFPPSMGSVCEYLRRDGRILPAYVYMPCYLGWGQAIRRAGPYGGFLGKRYDPLFTECDPYADADAPAARPGHPNVVRGEPRLPDSGLTADMTLDRLQGRRGLLGQIDDQLRRLESGTAPRQYNQSQQRAFSVLTADEVRGAFDLGREDPRLLDRYGRTLFGNCALIGRRLVQAGVRFVNVTWDLYWERKQIDYDCWDTHTRNFAILRENKLPHLDQTYTALLEDLDRLGLLDETLVVIMSEMGRTPRINANAGRDHWTFCYSVVLAGAGIRGGTVHGASDAHAAYVKDRPVSTADLCATIYQCLGIDPEMTVPDRSGRPVSISHGGQPIREILA